MSLENAKKIKLPEAKHLLMKLSQDREKRLKQRVIQTKKIVNHDADDQSAQTNENSKSNENREDMIKISDERANKEFRVKSWCRSFLKMCCCKKSRVFPDATQSIDK
ncbi:hypothetical protein SteCoe_12864 [Stentor coeruleus]|uniref:Uncharacterized protein n=1 Tax=Stentor coeruleus TaxID=5963 RepID=A0A1R2C9Q4_9CILI|nr:hypothetical protein SteCoe_12864 [Stentor coeruleus]